MLTREDNELLCRVGPGTPMGDLMRRFWIPAVMSTELQADGAPMRLLLLGEKLIAFRATDGRVGVIDNECPHRLASMFYARNEDNGLRCIYHGWKFDVTGQCVDMPNVPPDKTFKDRLKTISYQVRERNGVIWVYMGQGEAPALPDFPICNHPAEEMKITRMQQECNWLQVIEGDQDTSHGGFLHATKQAAADFKDERRFAFINRSPDYEVMDTDWGTMYGAVRPGEDGKNYWRVGHYCFPFWSSGRAANGGSIVARVPMDDHHTMSFQIIHKPSFPKFPDIADRKGLNNFDAPDSDTYQPNTTDWYGYWRPHATLENDHLIDRERQKNFNFSGIRGVAMQDNAVQESMGPIANRTKEHLAVSDRMIMVTRKRMLDTVKKFRDTGEVPLIASQPEIFAKLAGVSTQAPKDLHLLQVYEQFALPNLHKLHLQPRSTAAE